MKYLVFLVAVLIFSTTISAQFIQDNNGRPYQISKYEEYEGSPLLFKDWVNAKVVASNGRNYENLLINIDLYQDLPLFFTEGKVYSFSDDITEFTLIGEKAKITFKKGSLIDKGLPNLFYEVVSTTPLLLRSSVRDLTTVTTYGEAVKRYRFTDKVTFYAAVDGKVQKISLTKTDAEKVLSGKWKEILAFAEKNKISFKTQEGWLALVNHYHTIK